MPVCTRDLWPASTQTGDSYDKRDAIASADFSRLNNPQKLNPSMSSASMNNRAVTAKPQTINAVMIPPF